MFFATVTEVALLVVDAPVNELLLIVDVAVVDAAVAIVAVAIVAVAALAVSTTCSSCF
jgi:hypothetical protein